MSPVTHRASRLSCGGLFVIGVAVLLAVSVRRNADQIVFLADDPSIHMAMAKNLVRHGVWGVTSEGFSSTLSSPLWTGVVAAEYPVFGVGDLAPLLPSLFFGLVGAWAVAAVLALPLLAWGGRATAVSVRVSQNIYQQQY